MVLDDNVRRYYEDNPRMVSSPFGGVDGIDDALLESVWRALNIDPAGKQVVDVGCGRGFAGEVVEALGGRYAGADFVASRKGFPLALADAGRLPFADACADLVCCIDAFEHFPDAAGAVAEFARILKPGGTVFLSVPNYANVAGLVKWWCERFGRYDRHSWAPFGRWQRQELEYPITPGHIRGLFGAAGFRAMRYIGYGPEVGLGLFPWVEHRATPDAIRFRLQRLFRTVGPNVAQWWPSASLHLFWRIER